MTVDPEATDGSVPNDPVPNDPVSDRSHPERSDFDHSEPDGSLAWQQQLTMDKPPGPDPDASITLYGGNTSREFKLDVPRVPDYEIKSLLARGGMGIVYKATQTQLKRVVALKMMRGGDASADSKARFRAEAEAVARLQHPNIIQIFQVGEFEGRPFYSMEFVDGGSLDARLQGEPQLPRESARLIEQLARAIHVAHQLGIIHRDLKPSNVLLDFRYSSTTASSAGPSAERTRSDVVNGPREDRSPPPPNLPRSKFDHAVPKIVDFGLAKYLDDDGGQTHSGMVMGTPCYMAPEQAAGRTHELGPATDIYSLGAILYEMLTGRPPFRGETLLQTLDQVRSAEAVPPTQLQPRLPRDLETICLKCLHKEPQHRYATAEDLAEDLRRFLAAEPIQARAATVFERSLKWARRRPLVAGLVAVGVLAIFSLSTGAFLYSFRQHELRTAVEQDLARQAEKRREFQRLYDEAMLYSTRISSLELAESLRKTRTAAREALRSIGVHVDDAQPRTVDGSHNGDAPQRLQCCTLLLTLADAIAHPLPGENRTVQARRALTVLDQAIALSPPTAAYRLRRDQYLRVLGKVSVPAKANLAAPEPENALDLFLVGMADAQRRDWNAARRRFEEALRLEPEHFWARFNLAIVFINTQKPSEAKLCLDACLARKPDFAWTLLLRGFSHGELANRAANQDGIPREKRQTAVALHRKAADDDFAGAARLPLNDDARFVLHINRGVLRLHEGRPADAENDFLAAIELRPTKFQPFVNLAEAYTRQKKTTLALEQLDRAIALEPGQPVLYRARARLHLLAETRNVDAARNDLELAIKTAGGEKEDAFARAMDYKELGLLLAETGKRKEALASFEAALRLRPEFAVIHRHRAETLTQLEQWPDALQAWSEYLRAANLSLGAFLKTGEPVADAYRARAEIHRRLGDARRAEGDLLRAAEIESIP